MKKTRLALFQSIVALVLCVSMLTGTTFAWFTDSVSSGTNMIAAGSLDIELDYLADDGTWKTVKESTEVLDKDALWEPGHTEVAYLRIKNAGSLALKYALGVGVIKEKGSINAAGEKFFLSDHIRFGVIESMEEDVYATREDARKALGASSLISAGPAATQTATLNKNGDVRYVTLVVYMPEDVGNVANHATGVDAPEIQLGIKLTATQADYESDSFGSDYDSNLALSFNFPNERIENTTSVGVGTNEDNKVSASVTLEGEQTIAVIPEGVLVENGTSVLTLEVSSLSKSEANITLQENEEARSLNVHVAGVSADNTQPMAITIKEAAAKGLNAGNLKLYHVENGETVEMTAVTEFTAHNQFKYDPATGDVTLYMATFSEVALVADTENAWNGTVTTAFAGGTGTEKDPYIIANADQLAYLNECISNDNENDNYGAKHYKLIANINLGGEANANNGIIFYPIGYHKVGGPIATVGLDDAPEAIYEINEDSRQPGSSVAEGSDANWYTYGGAFKGIFDGDGHTISNIYQNTWQLKGNYGDNYWNAAMGLFGYVYGGTIKNLTVQNFSSDGEFTPTGVIAAYAAGDAIFENIAITNCNPRVYNTGNGGIIGIAGSTGSDDDSDIILKNITVDNSNKISALWGSWDVACGGLVGMYRGNVDGSGNETGDTISFENCHVSAQIDVYNDVCANYQYYAYRYAGMIIGSVRHNTTNTDGKTIPDMTGISASGCTANFGTWNDYYYCELVDNTTASYTHDYQMSRLTEIKAIDGTTITYLDGTTGTVPASGRANYVIVDYTKGHGTENATCYHFKDGAVWTHDLGGIQTGVDENGDGQDDLREDKQHLYLEFNNLFTGYGWGVSSMGIDKWNGIEKLGVTTGNHEKSVEKFEGKVNELANNKEYKLGDIFNLVDSGVKLVPSALTVSVTNLDENNPVSAVFKADTNNWENGALKLTGAGRVQITIQDYYFCTPTTIEVTVTDRQPEEKFDIVMNNGDFLHRVGNSGTVPLDKLFKAKDGVTVGTVSVTVEAVNGSGASGTYSNNAIQFNGTGVVKVTITDNDYCEPTVLELEVVDAVNATSATSATSNNVVLLNDCGFSSLEVSGGYALYGNGFTMTCGSDSAALDMGYSFVTLNNGTLDNVQIVTPNFDYAVLYKSNMTESGNRSQTTDKTRYFNVKSGVMVNGNSRILNSRVSGARAAVNVTGGNCVIDNSRIELGAVASLLVGAANSVTLRDVTLTQKPTASTYNPNKTLMGFSVLFVCDANGNAAPVTLEGTLVQNAWVDENDKQYVPSAGQSIISTVLGKTEYLHDLNGDGTKESLNLGFAYMPESLASKVNTTTITDNRTNKNAVPYDYAEVPIANGKTYVYSYKNTNGTEDSYKTETEYAPNKQSDNITVTYSDTTDGLESGKSFGTDGWVYELNVDLDKQSGYKLDFSKLSMNVNGVSVTDFKVNGNAKPTSPVAVTAGGVTYTLTATVNGKEYTATYKVTGTETSKESPSLVAANYAAGLCVASSYGGTWHGAAPALEGIQIKYWSVAEKQYKTINLSDYTPNTKGQLNGTNTTWTYSPANGDFTLTLTGGQVHSSNNVYAMPVVCNGKLYFVAAKSNGLVNSGNSARTIPVGYTFKDNNNGDVLTFSHTWSVAENKDAQYKYSDFCSGTLTKLEASGGGDCVTGDTLITLANGEQKRIDQLTYQDELLVWDFYNGCYATTTASVIFNHGEGVHKVTNLNFSDGTSVGIIGEHEFFDVETNAFVNITEENVSNYVGHKFVKADGNGYSSVVLQSYHYTEEKIGNYTILTARYNNAIVEGMLSLTPDPTNKCEDFFRLYEVGENMKFDEAKMQADIEKYGLFTYEDLAEYVTYEEFVAFNGEFYKILVGKGLITVEDIVIALATYAPNH